MGDAAARPERGTGLLGTTIGLATVIAMLGFAASVTIGLWTRSTVDSIAYDAARSVATSPTTGPADAMTQSRAQVEIDAIRAAKDQLGDLGDQVDLQFEAARADQVVLHVRAPGNALLPRMIGGGPVVGAIDRRIVIRREGQ